MIEDQTIEQAYPYCGKLWDRYQVYLACTPDLYPLTFDEWLGPI
jgi:hypothetical protein